MEDEREEEDALLLIAESQTQCTFDALNLTWKVPFSRLQEDCGGGSEVALLNGRNETFASFPVCTAEFSKAVADLRIAADPPPKQTIWCKVEEDCDVPPAAVSAIGTGWFGEMDDASEPSKMTIAFDRPTNTPDVSSVKGVDSVLSFSTRIGDHYHGEWLDEKTLQVTVTDHSTASERKRLSVGNLGVYLVKRVSESAKQQLRRRADASVREAAAAASGSKLVRVEDPGAYRLQFAGVPGAEIQLQRCDAAVLLRREGKLLSASSAVAWAMEGTVALDGTRPLIILKSSVVDPDGDGAWSVSFWLQLAHGDDSDSHRALFYKGLNPSDNQRTPSAWLLPHSRTISLRHSTNASMDVGAEARRELEVGKWMHVAVTFSNSTQWCSRIFLDGVLELEWRPDAGSRVVGNEGSVHLLKDPWRVGVKGLVRDAKIYTRALSRSEIVDEQSQTSGRGIAQASSLDTALVLSSTSTSSGRVTEGSSDSLDGADAEAQYAIALVSMYGEQALDEAEMSATDIAAIMPNLDAAQLRLRAAAGKGHAGAARMLASIFQDESMLQPAAMRHADAALHVVLANRLREKNCEAAAYHYHAAADLALAEHHSGSAEQINERRRLTEPYVEVGEGGEDDERIEFQLFRANSGHVPSQVAMGDLYYYGAHGLPRDHAQAMRFYNMAAAQGSASGMVGVAAMALKGEGLETRNTTMAVQHFERAAALNNTRALNGLGYIYFDGSADGIEKNTTAAYEYFLRAADLGDSDALHNTAHLLWEGIGVEKDWERAVGLYEKAAGKGNFGAIVKVGSIYRTGQGVSGPDCEKSLKYLRPAGLHGSWSNVMRKAFNHYINGNYDAALLRYLEAAAFGLEEAHTNVAFLLDRGFVNVPSEVRRKLAFKHMQYAASQGDHQEWDTRIALYMKKGLGTEKDSKKAYATLQEAYEAGSQEAAFTLGEWYEEDGEFHAARHYYRRAGDMGEEASIVVKAALGKLAVKQWAQSHSITISLEDMVTVAVALVLVLISFIWYSTAAVRRIQGAYRRWRARKMQS
eukprot:g3373.t1